MKFFNLGRVLPALALLALIALSCVFIQRTHNYLGTVPMATDDDSIPNVAINLFKNNQYGFPASPSLIHYGLNSESILKEKHFDGTHDYYNYGWFYFVTTGFLNFIVGDDSMLFFRMMTPLGILIVVFLGTFLFSEVSLLPGALLAIGLIGRFFLTVSPVMSRPDIAVSVTAALFFVSSRFAFEKRNFFWWFVTGFWAATAATSHLVAWSLVPAAGFTWILFAIIPSRSSEANDEKKKSFIGMLCGGLLGIFIYLVMMGFRILDLWSFVSFLNQHIKKTPYFFNTFLHFRIAWTSAGFSFVLGFGGFLLSVALLAASFKIKKSEVGIKILAFTAAPTLSTIFYVLSLGGYRGMVNPAYGLFTNVATMWSMAGAVATLLWIYSKTKSLETRSTFKHLTTGIAALLLVISIPVAANVTAQLERLKYGWVKYSDYERQVLDFFPPSAYIWGTLNFGFTSGVRTQLIDSNSALALAFHYNEAGWKKIAPDYLALTNYYTLESYLRVGPLSGKDSPIAVLRQKLPSFKYEPVRIVYAPPYGNTFIYKKMDSNQAHDSVPLTIAVNDGIRPNWLVSAESIGSYKLKTLLVRVPPVTIDTSLWGIKKATAHSSVKLDLERGFYLVKARVEQTDPEQTSAVVATPGRYFYAQEEVRLQHAPFFRGQTEASFIVDHLGGPLYLSYFPGRTSGTKRLNSSKNFEIVSVARVMENAEDIVKLPALEMWRSSEQVETRTFPDGAVHISRGKNSDSGSYDVILTSPEVSVKKHRAYTLIIPSEMNSGSLRVAILNKKGQTLLFGETRPLPSRIGFYAGSSDTVVIKIHGQSGLNFTLRPALLVPHFGNRDSIEEILSCPTTGKWIDGSAKFCAPVGDKELRALDEDLMGVSGSHN